MSHVVDPSASPASVVPYTNPWAIAALVAGCAQLILFAPATIVAIVAGHVARSEIRQSGGTQQGQGMATAGLVLGYCGLLLPVLLVLMLMTAG